MTIDIVAPPVPDTKAAIKFFQKWRPEGPWVITAIKPEQTGLDSETYGPGEEAQLAAWIEERQGKDNIYFTVNPLMSPMKGKGAKAKKTDVRGMAWLHTDLDPRPMEPGGDPVEHLRTERERALKLLREYKPAPTIIIDSGGGYQAFWRLDEEQPVNGDVTVAERLEGYNLQIEITLGADKVHNLDRIMRVPGTLNVPNEKKRKKGRVLALASVVEWHPERIYRLSDFQAVKVNGAAGSATSVTVTLRAGPLPRISLDKLPPKVSDKTKMLIVQGGDPDEPAKWADRSRLCWHVTCQLVRDGCTDEEIASIFLDRDFKISAHVLDQGNPRNYIERQIRRAREAEANEFVRDKDSKIVSGSQYNIRLAIRKLGVTVRHDKFQDQILISGLDGGERALDDPALDRLWLEVDEEFKFRPSQEFFTTVIEDAARQNSFHPVRDYLDGLAWDGTARVDKWLVTYGKAKDTKYVRAVGALMLIAAVRRVRKPGCKFDEMLVLEGKQGTNKSSALKALAINENWFADNLPLNSDGKKAIELLRGRWIVECAELQGLKRGEIEHVKAFVSRQVERDRLSYDRLTSSVPRQCVFFGTTNGSKYLRDNTGARRFWPVGVVVFDVPALVGDRDQLWAEAAARESAGESIRMDPSLYEAAALEQSARSVDDPFLEQLAYVLGDQTGKILNMDAWEIVGVPMGMRNQDHNARFGEALKTLGWEKTQARIAGKPANVYAKGNKKQRAIRLVVVRDANGALTVAAEKPAVEQGKLALDAAADRRDRAADGDHPMG